MAPSSENYDNVIIGYWVNKGTADTKMLEYMKKTNDKKVIENGYELLNNKNVVLDHFICQGKIDPALTEMFKKFPSDHPHAITPERKKV
jgi:hypothetical protein